MGILCDKNFKSGEINNEKTNDIIATTSFIDDAMGRFIENCTLREMYDMSAVMSRQPETGVSKVTKLPYSKINHWIIKRMPYREKLEMCKKIAPSLFDKNINKALGEMGEIRNRIAHEWFRGGIMSYQDKKILTDFCECYNLNESFKDISDEYDNFQKLYNEHRDFILTLEQKSSSEFLGIHGKEPKQS